MPFNPINFAYVQPQGNPALRDFIENVTSGYKSGQLPAQMERKTQEEELANALQKFKLEHAPETLNLENRLKEAQIASALSLANQRKSGGGLSGGGAGSKEEMFFQSLIMKDNPGLTADQAYEASNALREGKTTLSDGTPIRFSPASQASLDRITKYGTTGSLITQGKTAEQAEKEIDVLSKYIGAAVTPYGDTFYGYSPKQIIDTFSSKPEDQIKLGRLAAAQQLQTDLAAIQNKLNSGQSTATITNEILDRSEMMLKTQWPRMSNTARQEAMRYLKEALKEGFKARSSVRIGASNAFTPLSGGNSNATLGRTFNLETGSFE